jgi:NADH-quinone oxidoreductase E subunit
VADDSAARRAVFSDKALAEYREVVSRYPTRRAALLPTLWIAQREFGWISPAVEEYVAQLMELPVAQVGAMVSFYTMFYRQPVGRFHLEVCNNLPCRLRGAQRIIDFVGQKLAIKPGETTDDGMFTLGIVECMASCGTAPMLQLNHDTYFENLTTDAVAQIIDELRKSGD